MWCVSVCSVCVCVYEGGEGESEVRMVIMEGGLGYF
jgi:hypothetical protein